MIIAIKKSSKKKSTKTKSKKKEDRKEENKEEVHQTSTQQDLVTFGDQQVEKASLKMVKTKTFSEFLGKDKNES